MTKNLLRILTAAGLAVGAAAVAPGAAEATSAQCAVVRTTNVGGFGYSRIPTKRICRQDLSYGVAGSSSQVIVSPTARSRTALRPVAT